jgi:hypothetical protein
MAETFYFAWADSETEFDPDVHSVQDEDVFAFTLTQEEGDFAALSCDVRNPRVGLLAPGRKTWVWFSFNDGTTITPLFFGRLIAIPDNIFAEVVTFKFTARPLDFADQKAALAETLRVAPYWDPIFISPDAWEDDDVVLEARTALWHIDPVTHAVTISDVLTGEDGTVEFTEDDFFYDSMSVTLGTVPLRSVSMIATIPWTITGTGTFPLGPMILAQWDVVAAVQFIDSFTLEGLASSWPKQGAKIGVGWTVERGELVDVSYTAMPQLDVPFYYVDGAPTALPVGSVLYPIRIISGKEWSGTEGAGYDVNIQSVFAPVGYGIPTLDVSYDANRTMAQTVAFTLKTDMQALMTAPDQDDTLVINLSGNNVSDLLGFGGHAEVPIGDVRRRQFVTTERGRSAVEHLILIARANLVIRSRAISVSFQTDLKTGLGVSLRKGVLIHDPRLPGGEASGKVTGYEFSLDGGSGAALASIKFGAAVGYGGSHSPSVGDPTWVEDDYVELGYQEYINEVVLVGAGDVTYSLAPEAVFDDGIDFNNLTPKDIVKQLVITHSAAIQRDGLVNFKGDDQAQVSAYLQTVPTQISLQLIPAQGGPFQGIANVGVSDLLIPKQIDLEAPSV